MASETCGLPHKAFFKNRKYIFFDIQSTNKLIYITIADFIFIMTRGFIRGVYYMLFNELRWLIFHIVLKVVKMYKTNLSLPLVNLFIQLFLYLQLCSRTQKTTRSCIKLNSWTSCHRICVSIHTGRHVTAARRSTHTGDLNLPNTDSNSGENEEQPLEMLNLDVECW